MKKILLVIIATLILFAAFGCSARSAEMSADSYAYDSPTEEPLTEDIAMEAPAEEWAENTAAAESSYDEESASGIGDLPDTLIPETSRKLIYSASFSIDTKNFSQDYASIKTALGAVNGYIESEYTGSDINEHGTYRFSEMILRVPVSEYNDFLDKLSDVGSVRDKQISTQDISDQYFDTDARIEILEQQHQRLLEHLESAKKTADIISLESELSDVLYELDQLKGSRRKMDGMVNYASVDVSVTETLTPQTIMAGQEGRDPLSTRASDAYQMSLSGVGNFLQGVAVFFAAAAPVLLLLAVIGLGIWFFIRLVRYLKKKFKKDHS